MKTIILLSLFALAIGAFVWYLAQRKKIIPQLYPVPFNKKYHYFLKYIALVPFC
jgi:hypothetical protein